MRPSHCLCALPAVTLVLFATLASSHTASDPAYVTTASGRRIPAAAITARLKASSRLPHLAHHVYEHVGEVLTSGRNVIDLSVLRRDEQLRATEGTKHVVNGRTLAPFTPDVTAYTDGEDVLALYYEADLLQVSTRDLHLAPLGAPHHGLFVAVRSDDVGLDVGRHACSDDRVARHVMEDMARSPRKKRNPSSAPMPRAQMSPEARLPDSCASGAPHYLELAFAYDNTLCRYHGNDSRRTIAALHAMLMAASRPFLLNTCVRLALVHVDGHCNDPDDPYAALTSMFSFQIVPAFIAEWQKPARMAVHRDVLYLITGFNDGTTTLGFGFPGLWGGVCSKQLAFGWIEGIIPGVVAHNLGRNLGANRTEDGPGLMNAFYAPGAVPRFTRRSRDEIAEFIDNNSYAECISSEPPAQVLKDVTLVVPPKNTLPEYGSCATGWQKRRVVNCSRRKDVIGTIGDKMLGILTVRSFQQFAQFVLMLQTESTGVRMEGLRVLQHINNSYSAETLPLGNEFEVTQFAKITRRDISLRWPRPAL